MFFKLISLAALYSIPVYGAIVVQPNPTIKYVPMPAAAVPLEVLLTMDGAANLKTELQRIGKNMCEFINRVSRDKIHLTSVIASPPGKTPPIGPRHKTLRLIPKANSHVPIIGNAISAKHELGHEFRLGHANTRIWETQTKIKSSSHQHDPFDPITISPGVVSLNSAHIHYLRWYTGTEEAYAEDGGEYILAMLNNGSRDFQTLKTLYYQVPGTTRQIWFSYVHVAGKWTAPTGMPGTGVAIHEMSKAETYLEGLIGLEPKTNVRSGLILTLSQPTAQTVRVKVTKDPTWVAVVTPEDPIEVLKK